MLKTYSCVLTPVREIRLVWLSVHCGLPLSETADMLAKMALAVPVIAAIPPFACSLRTRYRQYLLAQDMPDHGLPTS